jgi:hypothetical protein
MALPPSSAPKPVPDWGTPGPQTRRGIGRRTATYLVLTLGVLIILTVATRDPFYVGIALVVLIAGAWHGSREGRRSLGAVGAIEVGESDRANARLIRLVSGLSGDLGMDPPGIWIFTGSSPNAFVTSVGSRGAVAVSTELASELALTELEAVVAHCLIRLRDGVPDPRWARSVLGWTKRIHPCAPASYDVGAAAMLRYPPGLARAIRKAAPRKGPDRGLWFVPAVEGECSPVARIARLEDL